MISFLTIVMGKAILRCLFYPYLKHLERECMKSELYNCRIVQLELCNRVPLILQFEWWNKIVRTWQTLRMRDREM